MIVRRAIAKNLKHSTATVFVILVVASAGAQQASVDTGLEDQAVAERCSSPLAGVADSVAAAFDDHQFVLIGSTHGSQKTHDFLVCLLSRPELQARVTDVLVEWANPVHQDLMDRYLLQLEDIPLSALTRVWFDTDAPRLWASLPQLPEFFATVRAINERLKPPNRLRVIGGCEPIDWSAVRSAEDIAAQPFKNNWAAHVVSEHFAPHPHKRLLVVYGDSHIHHNGGSMMGHLHDRPDRAALFVVGTIAQLGQEEGVGRFGDVTKPFFVGSEDLPKTGPYPGAFFYARDGALSQYVDSVVYLGPERDQDLSYSIELDAAQEAELARRDALRGDGRMAMQLRLRQRDLWFQSHPDDLPDRPSQ